MLTAWMVIGPKSLFTRDVCVCVNVNFNIELMVTQTHIQRMGPTPILCINHWRNVKVDVDTDTDVDAHVTCKQGLSLLHSAWNFFQRKFARKYENIEVPRLQIPHFSDVQMFPVAVEEATREGRKVSKRRGSFKGQIWSSAERHK